MIQEDPSPKDLVNEQDSHGVRGRKLIYNCEIITSPFVAWWSSTSPSRVHRRGGRVNHYNILQPRILRIKVLLLDTQMDTDDDDPIPR